MKLSKWFDKEVSINGDVKKCMSALLNPKDDMSKYKSSNFKCVKMELAPNYCFVADKYLYHTALNAPEVMEMYNNSVVPVEKYIFGSYRLPECLVTSTVIPGQVSSLHKMMDSPVLFDNSEELYINNIIETYKEKHLDFNDVMLYYFFNMLANEGKMDRIEDSENGVSIFIDKNAGKTYTIKIPFVSEY
jgi:hypothetical protein